jgi:esterase
VYVDEVLIPIECLINDASIVQVALDEVTYWHVELERHDVLLAEGLPAESYLDLGNRDSFANAGERVALHPDFLPRRWEDLCAPWFDSGPLVAAVGNRLLGRADTAALDVAARIDDAQEGSPALRGGEDRVHGSSRTTAARLIARTPSFIFRTIEAERAVVLLHTVTLGSGPPVAIMHGLFGAARNFGSIQKALAQRCRVIAIDLRNHGDSPHAPRMTYGDMAEDVRATLAAAHALPAAVIGHSMGGKTAMRLALDHPESVGCLIVSDIAPIVHPPFFARYTAAMRALPVVPGITRAQADRSLAPAIADPRIRAFLLQSLRTGPDPGWRIGLDQIEASLPALEGWETHSVPPYTGPTLFVRGEHSDYIRPEYWPGIEALFPRARLETVPNAGHWLHAENPNGFLSAVEAFLAQVWARRG